MSENQLSNGSLASNATPGLSAKMISRVSNALVLAGRKAILFGQPDLVAQRSAYHRNREAHYQNLLPFLRQRSCKFASRHLLISQLAACNRFDNLRETGVATLQPLRLLQGWLQLLSEARGMRASLPPFCLVSLQFGSARRVSSSILALRRRSFLDCYLVVLL